MKTKLIPKTLRLIASICTGSILATPAFAAGSADATSFGTTTPIKHIVVIFQENVSFDHYFATYPRATNPSGDPAFHPSQFTPVVNGLTAALLNDNPNLANPFRIARANNATSDQDHNYGDEQAAFHGGLMDRFVEDAGRNNAIVMGYFDGNTVTALWNYAQHFAMSDNCYGTTFGPSSPGAINLVSGQTHGAISGNTGDISGDVAEGSLIGDAQPKFDTASTRETVEMTGQNVGDLLNAKGITWGWFQGGFRNPTQTHVGADGKPKGDYIPHHEPFQYYATTANPSHVQPSSTAAIGATDQANHQYDLIDFRNAVQSGHLPAVSFLKAAGYQDGHAGYSSPLLEQTFMVSTINQLQKLPEWKDMLIVINYDDSDGWYDHAMGPIIQQSNTSADQLLGPGDAGTPRPGEYNGRAGYGPRLPLLVISPFARSNFVDHSVNDQSSILRFIENNWNLGRIGDQSYDLRAGSILGMLDFRHPNTPLFLNQTTGSN